MQAARLSAMDSMVFFVPQIHSVEKSIYERKDLMDFETLQRTRESCRVFDDRPVSREALTHLVDVARLCPSGCNAQPWKFIIVDEPEAKAKMVDCLDDDGFTGCPWGAKVPAFIVICEDEAHLKPGAAEKYGAQHFAQMDIGMAAMALCYEAATMGLGTCMIGTMSQEKLHKFFGIPQERTIRLIITVGYPQKAAAPRRKTRKSLEEIVRYNHW